MLANVPMIFILVGIVAYTVLAGADFGAGIWTLLPYWGSADPDVTRDHTRHAMGPVWEANHVWLIFVLVVCWTCYPTAFASIMTTLSIPLFIAAVGIIFRGASYALRGQLVSRGPGARLVENLFALSSVLTPFAFGTVVGAITVGRVPVGNAAGDVLTAWLGSVSILAGVLAVAFSAYLAAVYLAADARRLASPALVSDFRVRALCAGVVGGVLALAGLLVLRSASPSLWHGLTHGTGVAMVIVCALAGVVTMVLVWRSWFELARASAALAVAAVIAGWAAAQSPRLLPGLTVAQAAAGRGTLIATIVAVGAGAVVLVPSLGLLYTLLLRGRLDQAAGAGSWQADPGAAPGPAPGPAPGAAVHPGRASRGAWLAGGVAAVCLVAGVGLVVFASAVWAQGIGAVLLLTCAITVFSRAATEA